MILIWTALGHAALRRLREARSIQLYPSPTLVMQAREPLPELPWFETIETVARQVIAPLPPGASIAASEVGLIGAAAPHVGVIDLSGLNDNDIALHGFRMDALLDRKPVLIWFPHTHYTWQRQQMFCSPRLLEEYLLLGGNAFNYSIAVRKDSAGFASVWQHVTDAFDQLYPGRNINSYLVTGIERNGVCAGP